VQLIVKAHLKRSLKKHSLEPTLEFLSIVSPTTKSGIFWQNILLLKSKTKKVQNKTVYRSL
jgi:hypothetical protein